MVSQAFLCFDKAVLSWHKRVSNCVHFNMLREDVSSEQSKVYTLGGVGGGRFEL